MRERGGEGGGGKEEEETRRREEEKEEEEEEEEKKPQTQRHNQQLDLYMKTLDSEARGSRLEGGIATLTRCWLSFAICCWWNSSFPNLLPVVSMIQKYT